eukprot:CAMPEP_0181238278 /NCGR_PEP_ID=MMETSP1096-20121128/39247_1 /TAXON_ID=156174 ORGANISM="Chrysochromulina ericina, Strain CCMP281" /NCGR_SAMPLE_ID=MMETSP1096 /ASSEMBLY_ACC=CAM_ASM_000453 /LENGTH=76 /DNA_ID=CAMNT_0023333761 /DNA_START=333 /DNA_END=560 /DNA_ORIENTATION=+
MGKPLGAHTQPPLLIICQQQERRVVRFAASVISRREERHEVAAMHKLRAVGHELVRPDDEPHALTLAEPPGHVRPE